MIQYIEGNIFQSPAQVLVNPVNTVGVMGKGLALSFKKRYPEMFKKYRTVCENGQFGIGKLMLYYALDHWVLLFPTKENWRHPSKLQYIEEGLQKFVDTYVNLNITSIAFPRLGCGNGELNWDVVRPIMERYLKPLPINNYIYIGVNTSNLPEHKDQQNTLQWLKSHSKDMSFNGVKDDIIHQETLLPITFVFDNRMWTVQWNSGIEFVDDTGNDIKVNEDDFYQTWDDIRNKGFVKSCDSRREIVIVYELLKHLGYLSSVRICNENGAFEEGYQLNEGLGRMFALRENQL